MAITQERLRELLRYDAKTEPFYPRAIARLLKEYT